MDEQVVNRMCERIMGFFERPPSYGGRFKALALAECVNFPNAFADFLVAHFKGLDRWPQNVAREIGMAWGHWRESNPQMCARRENVDCDVCGGLGWIEFLRWRDDGAGRGEWVTESCLCGHCRPHGLTVQHLAANGCEAMPLGGALSEAVKRNKGVTHARGGPDFSGRLDAWRKGQRPDERVPIPDDDRPDMAEGW